MKSGQLQIIIVMRDVEEQCFGRDPGGDELGEPAVKRAGGPRWKPPSLFYVPLWRQEKRNFRGTECLL